MVSNIAQAWTSEPQIKRQKFHKQQFTHFTLKEKERNSADTIPFYSVP